MRDVAVARFTRTLGTLVSAGLPALTALRITKGTLGNKAMEREIDFVCDEVAHGKTIADPMERSGYFPPLLVQIVGMPDRLTSTEIARDAAGQISSSAQIERDVAETMVPPVLEK